MGYEQFDSVITLILYYIRRLKIHLPHPNIIITIKLYWFFQKHGPRMKCSACKIIAHSNCIDILMDRVKFACKPTFRDVGVRQYREQTVTHHHWVHRRSEKGKCRHCSKVSVRFLCSVSNFVWKIFGLLRFSMCFFVGLCFTFYCWFNVSFSGIVYLTFTEDDFEIVRRIVLILNIFLTRSDSWRF